MYKKLRFLMFIIVSIVLTAGLSISFQSLLASWSVPPANPPTMNASEPINIGNIGQSKNSGLVVNAASVNQNGLVVLHGDVGVGTDAPVANLDVVGGIKVGYQAVCTEGVLRFTGSDFEGCKAGNWVSFTATGSTQIINNTNNGKDLVVALHSSSECTDVSIGGTVVDLNPGKVCKVPGASCPAGWTQYAGWSETRQGVSCSYCGSGCNPCSCSPGGHAFTNNNAIETCTWSYGRADKYGNGCSASICSTERIAIGCY